MREICRRSIQCLCNDRRLLRSTHKHMGFCYPSKSQVLSFGQNQMINTAPPLKVILLSLSISINSSIDQFKFMKSSLTRFQSVRTFECRVDPHRISVA